MKISEILSAWYKNNARSLPWRKTSDPYLIWISEIILQQTRVNQGLSYYLKFSERFSNVKLLAKASEEDVLNLWQGLGYYSRARNMHSAADQIVKEFNGIFPTSYERILTLKGVGNYTAAAIASIAFNEAVAVLDGNVARVLSRLFGVDTPINTGKGAKELQELADLILDHQQAGIHNQAIMEFGALHCTPVNPRCETCPLQTHCIAFKDDIVKSLPVKLKKIKIKVRYFYYAIIEQGECTYLRKRTGKDIWKSLYEFPMFESSSQLSDEEIVLSIIGLLGIKNDDIHFHSISDPIKHQLTHRTIMARFIHVEPSSSDFSCPADWMKIPKASIGDYPLPRLIDRYLEGG